MTVQETLVQWLFSTRALRVAPADQPFWYASGTLGPYYVNTHFLYGSEAEAVELLAMIDSLADRPAELPGKLAEAVRTQYKANRLYHDLMDLVIARLDGRTGDFISGGERRDFFFSIPAALLLDQPHVSIMKDGTAVYSQAGFGEHHILADQALAGGSAVHLADLVTEASSYTRAWLPAIRRLGARMPLTLAVIDRGQGGREALAAAGTELISLAAINPELFDQAAGAGLIDDRQNEQIKRFISDPEGYMTCFLTEHPDFLESQLALGGKSRERALRCLERGYGAAR